jgi:hypothetical protein
MEQKQWVQVWVSQNQVDASLIQIKMEEVGIPVVLMNQQDSSYGVFGDIKIWVPKQEKEAAVGLLLTLGFNP